MKLMKILQVNKFLYPKGGVETYLFALSNLLVANGHKVVYFSQKNPKNIKNDQEKYFVTDLDLGRFNFKALLLIFRIFWSPLSRYKIKKLIKHEQPELVHIHNIYHQLSPSILAGIKEYGLPTVMTVHDFKLVTPGYALRADGVKKRHKDSLIIDWLLKLEFAFHRLIRIYDRCVDIFIAPSQFVKNELVKAGYQADKIAVIPHFIKMNTFSVQENKEKYFFTFGRLDESKGMDDIIRAFAALPENGLKLKIAGTGPEEKNLRRLIKKFKMENRIELTGFKQGQELLDLIGNSLAVVFASRVQETFGLTVLESLALGKAVIASKVGAIPELIEDGRTGLLFAVADIGELKEKMSLVLRDDKLRQKLEQAGQAKAREYSPEKHYKQLAEIYNKLAAPGSVAKRKIRKIALSVILAVCALLIIWPIYYIDVNRSRAFITPQHDYPRLANLYWKNPITMGDAKELAKWDVIVLDMQTQTNSASAIKEIKRLNPKAVILAYTTANEMPVERLSQVEPSGSGLWHELAKGDKAVWRLKTIDGNSLVFWPGNVMMNLGVKDENGQTYAGYLTDFYQDKILSTGLWDGLFFDNVWQNVTWFNKNIDIDNNGRQRPTTEIDWQWQNYYRDFFQKLRDRFGSQYLIIGNGDGAYHQLINGRMFESFPDYWQGGWSGSLKSYNEANDNGYAPRLNIIESNTANTGNRYDYQSLRYGLASSLMFDGYYAFGYGTNLREQLWWYDEYDAQIGQPVSEPYNLSDKNSRVWKAGVWQRDFEFGTVVVNSTDKPQTISFDGEYEKLRGTQDKTVNDGAIINRLTLAAGDGIIMMRPLNTIMDATYINGSFARIFDGQGQVKRNGFFSYDGSFKGSNKILKLDLNNDGERETVVAGLNSITLYNKRGLGVATVYPYGDRFVGGLSLAPVKVEGNKYWLAIGPEKGGSNLIKFYDENLSGTGKSFNAYGSRWPSLGANVASGNVDGDGQSEIIVGAGFGGGPHVKVFDLNGNLEREFFAYGNNFRGGVNVASGDVDGDGQSEIITGAGQTGGPHIRVWNQNNKIISQWFGFDSNKRTGVNVTSGDVDGDGRDEVIALTTNVFMSNK